MNYFFSNRQSYKEISHLLFTNSEEQHQFIKYLKEMIIRLHYRSHPGFADSGWAASDKKETIGKLKQIDDILNELLIPFGDKLTNLEQYDNFEEFINFSGEEKFKSDSDFYYWVNKVKLLTDSEIKNSLKDISEQESHDICSICDDEMDTESELLKACNKCKNKFHGNCIQQWLDFKPNQTCPLCRAENSFNNDLNIIAEQLSSLDIHSRNSINNSEDSYNSESDSENSNSNTDSF